MMYKLCAPCCRLPSLVGGRAVSLFDARRYWVAALLASRASLSMANSFFLCGWLAFIAGDVYAFASGHRHEVVHKKST